MRIWTRYSAELSFVNPTSADCLFPMTPLPCLGGAAVGALEADVALWQQDDGQLLQAGAYTCPTFSST